MPEDSKKQDKRKNDPKEQRKPRNARVQANRVDRKAEKEESKSAPKVSVPQKPPVYEDPGPEFYKNLKRETEEILKINEEERSKYKKKEIQSNWSKYEMPIESYEEIEEHDLGADYEKLIQAPLSIGGHFQFKHEKSWDVNTGPSLYDKYFEINMDNLSLAVSTIPFFERNDIEQSLFSETDMLSMNNRAIKYKQKYYDDKSYFTPETEAQDKILNSLKEALSEKKEVSENIEDLVINQSNEETVFENLGKETPRQDDINLEFNNLTEVYDLPSLADDKRLDKNSTKEMKQSDKKIVDPLDDVTFVTPEHKAPIEVKIEKFDIPKAEIETPIKTSVLEDNSKCNVLSTKVTTVSKIVETLPKSTAKDNPAETKENPVIESPEDLEKWLDDFLDG